MARIGVSGLSLCGDEWRIKGRFFFRYHVQMRVLAQDTFLQDSMECYTHNATYIETLLHTGICIHLLLLKGELWCESTVTAIGSRH